MPGTLEAMRDAMRKVMSEAYINGCNDCQKIMMEHEGGRGDE